MKNIFGNNLRCVTCCVLVLAGCAQPGAPVDHGPKAQHSRPSSRSGALMLYAEYLQGLSASDFARELDHLRQLAAQDKSQYRQLQYALALSAPGGDIRRAQQVIDAVRESGRGDPELAALAAMISANLAERRRLEARLEAGTKRVDELEKKVEAVKNIEKAMIERDRSAEKP